jgi:hypothetical protein
MHMVLFSSVPVAVGEAPGPFLVGFPQEGQNAASAPISFPQFSHIIGLSFLFICSGQTTLFYSLPFLSVKS